MVMFVSFSLLILVTGMTVFGDYLIKTATGHHAGMMSVVFALGALSYGASAIGWFFLMRSHSLTWIAVSYSAATLVFLALLGVIMFEETLRPRDVMAVAMALGAMLLINQD